MSNYPGKLTRYSEGSIHELWAISFPLMLSLLSNTLLTFVDRLMLSKYNTQAMNAAVVAWMVFGVFQYSAVAIASISEVFVGQYNGAKKFAHLGEPVWQMIWFSVMTLFIFIPFGLWGGPLFIPNPEYLQDGVPYFKWLMIFGAAAPLDAALSAFFIGQGRGKLIMLITLLSNIVNILLDYVLIFGVSEVIPAMGASGAAIATGVAQLLQALVLLGIFLLPKYKDRFGTHLWRFNSRLFFKAIKIGLPAAISNVTELLAWIAFSYILTSSSEAHITIYSIGDSFFVLFGFAFWGLQRGVTSLVANYLGANREEMVSEALQAGVKIVFIISLVVFIPLFFYPEFLIKQFLEGESGYLMNEELVSYATQSMRWLWLYFVVDVLSWLFAGVLTAAGDTKFVMMMNSASAWLVCVIPTYICLYYFEGSPVFAWQISVLYGLINAMAFLWRYRSKRWEVSMQQLQVVT